MPVNAPFRFARINRRIYEPAWADLVSHDVPFADGLSGEAEVEITATSSILVGGDRRRASAREVGEVRPFQLPDGTYAIPGSALQGMARAILEVAGFGRLGPWVADRKFGIRDLSGTPTAREHYQSRLSTNSGGRVTIHSKAGWLMKSTDGSPRILPCKFARIHLDDVRKFKGAQIENPNLPEGTLYGNGNAKCRYQWLMENRSIEVLNAGFEIDAPEWHHHSGRIRINYSRCRHDPRNGTPGTLVLTGKPQRGIGPRQKKFEFVFHGPDRVVASEGKGNVTPLSVDCDVWDAFLLLHEEQPGKDINPNWDFWRSEFDSESPVPVFYWEDAPGKVATLGMAYAFKAAHRMSARDLLGHSYADHLAPVETMKLDLAHLIFGVAAEHDGGRGLKRRARFSLARADGKPQPVVPEHPSILLGPKPSYVGLYVRQRHDNEPLPRNEPLATYTPLDDRPREPHLHRPELSGVKIWPARNGGEFEPGEVPDNLARNSRVQTKLVTLPPGTVFRSRLTFHNLRPVELGALLWALSFGDEAAFGDSSDNITKRHRLGMGKPLGLGEIAIRVTGMMIERDTSACDTDATKIAHGYVRDFEAHMSSAYGSKWSGSKQVCALLQAAAPRQDCDFEYMTLRQYGDAKTRAEYLPDYAADSHEISLTESCQRVDDAHEISLTESCQWVDDAIAALMNEHSEKDVLKILRGQPLARRWQALQDPALRQEALQDIVVRWQAQGWWDDPPQGRAARAAWRIYHNGLE